jgi:hypothetical protein
MFIPSVPKDCVTSMAVGKKISGDKIKSPAAPILLRLIALPVSLLNISDLI